MLSYQILSMTEPIDIVFIHGLADITKQWRRASFFLEGHGFAVHFFDYPTLSNELDIPAVVSRLQKLIHERIGSAPYQILAHSQGGLIAEWFDLFVGDPRLKRVVTIGTPYQGNSLPLFIPPGALKKLPVSRKQIEDLSYMSPVLCSILRKRIEKNSSPTHFVSLISHSINVLNMESDGVVSVCSGNRNADYYISDGNEITSINSYGNTASAFVKTSHLPVHIVHKLLHDRGTNPFAELLISALNGQPLKRYGHFSPIQSGLIIPTKLENRLRLSTGVKKIISRPTLDGKYMVSYFALVDANQNIGFEGRTVALTPAKFTYIFEPAFFNTGT